MKRCHYALALSIMVLFTGMLVSYLFHNITGESIIKMAEAVVESPMLKMTEARVEAVETIVEIVIEKAGVVVEARPELNILSTAMGIFFTNLITCYGTALTPLIPLLYYRYVTPRFSKKFKKGEDPWRFYRYATPLVPVAVLLFNGSILYMILSLAETIFPFIPFEEVALLMFSSIGLSASLNSDNPESLEKSYEDFWKITFHATLLLLIAAFMESILLSEVNG